MRNKLLWISAFCILIALALSGCWHEAYEFYHFPDGSGRVVIRSEITRDILALDEDDEVSSMQEVRDELHEYLTREGEFSISHPNIAKVTEEDYLDPATESLHYVTEVDVINMLEPIFDDEDLDENFVFTANPDGTYRFSVMIDASESDDGFFPDEDSMPPDEAARAIMESADYTFILHVQEFIEADPRAVYDPAEKTVTWVLPMSEFFSLETDLELWAIYRIEPAEVMEPTPVDEPVPVDPVETDPQSPVVDDPVVLPPPTVLQPEQDDGFLGLPNWVPFVLAGLCCLSLVAVVVVILVFVIAKKRKPKI